MGCVASHDEFLSPIQISQSEPDDGANHKPDEVGGPLKVNPESRSAHFVEVADKVVLTARPVDLIESSGTGLTSLLPVAISHTPVSVVTH